MQTITIHKATADDASVIAQMAHELAAFEGEPSRACEQSIAVALAGSEPRCYALLANAGKQAIGFALYYGGYDLSSASYGFHLADIFVKEAHRGQGAGRALIARIAAHAKEEEREWVSLTALATNDKAEAFYRQLGFHLAPIKFYAIGAKRLEKIQRKE